MLTGSVGRSCVPTTTHNMRVSRFSNCGEVGNRSKKQNNTTFTNALSSTASFRRFSNYLNRPGFISHSLALGRHLLQSPLLTLIIPHCIESTARCDHRASQHPIYVDRTAETATSRFLPGAVSSRTKSPERQFRLRVPGRTLDPPACNVPVCYMCIALTLQRVCM